MRNLCVAIFHFISLYFRNFFVSFHNSPRVLLLLLLSFFVVAIVSTMKSTIEAEGPFRICQNRSEQKEAACMTELTNQKLEARKQKQQQLQINRKGKRQRQAAVKISDIKSNACMSVCVCMCVRRKIFQTFSRQVPTNIWTQLGLLFLQLHLPLGLNILRTHPHANLNIYICIYTCIYVCVHVLSLFYSIHYSIASLFMATLTCVSTYICAPVWVCFIWFPHAKQQLVYIKIILFINIVVAAIAAAHSHCPSLRPLLCNFHKRFETFMTTTPLQPIEFACPHTKQYYSAFRQCQVLRTDTSKYMSPKCMLMFLLRYLGKFNFMKKYFLFNISIFIWK